MSDFEANTNTTEDSGDVWHVQLPTGEVRVMTLEQLDDAFQKGSISGDTHVYQAGLGEWAKLKDVAGLEAEEGPATTPHVNHEAFPRSAGATAWPPASTSSFPPTTVFTDSTTPVVSGTAGLDFDLDEVNFRSRARSRSALRWAGGAAILGVIGLAATARSWLSPSADAASLANAGAAMTPDPNKSPVPPAAPPSTPDTAAKAQADDRFSDDTKKALLDADKVRAERARAIQAQQAQQRANRPEPRVRTKSSGKPVFKKGGDRYDPLNSAL